MSIDTYFIREDYVPNEVAVSNDKVTGEAYWTPSRAYSSYYFQFPVYQYARNLIEANGYKTVLDVGCGPAPKLKRIHDKFPNIRIIGIDQPDPIAYCKETYDFGEWFVDDFSNPSNELETLKGDLVICADVIEHLPDPNLLLEYLKTKTSESGHILMSTPERDVLRGPDCTRSPNRAHIREWNFAELEAYLKHSGFHIIEHFLQLPTRFAFNRIYLEQVVKRRLLGKSARYNQVCLLELPHN